MFCRMVRSAVAALAGVLLLLPATCRAVLFASTNDVTYNTTAPGGALSNSGWQWEGSWGSYLGTPIAPTYFLAAKHIGGSPGQTFVLNGFTYHTLTNYPDPNSDLRVWKVAETFPSYAPLYTGTNEVGQHCVVFGRGTQRGDSVIVSNEVKGWEWGASDGIERWGENDLSAIVDGGPELGDLISATFDRSGGVNECHLSTGDSSGAVFIQDAGVWKLAGINYGVDGRFSNAVDQTMFDAALLDRGGLYQQNDTNGWDFISDTTTDNPSAFYSTRVSSRLSWINSVIDFGPGIDLRITGINCQSGDAVVSFVSTNGKTYLVQYSTNLTSGVWTTLTNNISGTGNILSVHDPGACALPKRFYRVGLVP